MIDIRDIGVYVYSREAIQAIRPHDDADHLIISISSGQEDSLSIRLPICSNTIGVHRTVFGDVDRDEEGKVPAMTADQAKAIWDFIEQHQGKFSRILLHCDGGRSRSPGVAASIAAMLNHDDKYFFERYTPNMHVYRTMINSFLDREDDHENQDILLD